MAAFTFRLFPRGHKWLQQLQGSRSLRATSECQQQKASLISSSLRNEGDLPRSLSGWLLVGQNCVTCPVFYPSLTRCTELQSGTIKSGTLAAPSGHPPRTPCCSVPEQTQISQVFFFFLILTIFKVFTEFVITLFLFYLLVFWSQGIWDLSSPTRDQLRSHTPCIGRQSRNHWTTREVPIC